MSLHFTLKLAWEHFKEYYNGQFPEDVYTYHQGPKVHKQAPFKQIVDINAIAHDFYFKIHEQKPKNAFKLLTKGMPLEAGKDDFKKRDFTVLSEGWSNVYEHDKLDGWLLKDFQAENKNIHADGWGPRANSFKYNHIHRAYYAKTIRKIMRKLGLNFKVEKVRLLASKGFENEKPHRKYKVFSKKLNVFPHDESLNMIRCLPRSEQRRIAIKICDFIKLTGITDVHEGNIVLMRPTKHTRELSDLKFALIDAEPVGIIKDVTDKSNLAPLSFEDAVLTGLGKFAQCFGKHIAIFAEEALDAKEEITNPSRVHLKRFARLESQDNWRIAKIVASVALPIIPLVVAIQSLIFATYGQSCNTRGTGFIEWSKWQPMASKWQPGHQVAQTA